MATPTQPSRVPYLVLAFALLGIGGYLFVRHEAKTPPPDEGPGGPLEPEDPTALRPVEVTAPLANDGAATSPGVLPSLDRAKADAIRARLKALYGGGTPAIMPAPQASSDPPFGVMPTDPNDATVLKEYIRSRVKDDYFPLAKSCYENALVQKPDLAGRYVMTFRISGDRRVGGVVESAEEDPQTTLTDEKFSTCMRESMMAVSFDAPPRDGHVDVTYPIEFSPDDAGENDAHDAGGT